MTEDESLIWASGHYLTERFPSHFEGMSDEELNEWIDERLWEPFENYDVDVVWGFISDLASSVKTLVNEGRV